MGDCALSVRATAVSIYWIRLRPSGDEGAAFPVAVRIETEAHPLSRSEVLIQFLRHLHLASGTKSRPLNRHYGKIFRCRLLTLLFGPGHCFSQISGPQVNANFT